jgi:hypothetical protein
MFAFIKILFIFVMQFGNNEIKAPFVCTAICSIPERPDCLCIHSGFTYMKEIKLTQGQVALVDDEDYDFLMQWKWYTLKAKCTYYAVRSEHFWGTDEIDICKCVRMHRIIMQPPDNMQIDHINHNGLDNRKCNLRIVTNRENMMNMKKGNKTGRIGIYKNRNKFVAKASKGGQRVYIGTFNNADEAHNAYLNFVSK